MIEKLEFLVAIAREQNFRRAAEACGVAQPTLSAGIKSLEESLGLQLVRRNSRYQGLTPEGERVLTWAHRLAGDYRAMRQDVNAFRHGLSGRLRLGVIPTALPYTPMITRRFRAMHPGVQITVLSRTSDEIIEQLNGLELEGGITYLGAETIGRLRAIPLYAEHYRLLTHVTSPLAGRASVTWTEVGALPLCLLSPDMQNRRILDRLLHPASFEAIAYTMETDSMIALLAHVRDGELSTVVSDQVAILLDGAEPYRAIPIAGSNAGFSVGLVAPDRQPTSPIVRALLGIAEELSRAGQPL